MRLYRKILALCLALTVLCLLPLTAYGNNGKVTANAASSGEWKLPPKEDTGIMRISMSVTDLQKTSDFFIKEIGLKEVGGGSLTAAQVKQLYGVEGTTAKYTMFSSEGKPTLLELMEFDPKPTASIRPTRPSWDYGYYDIAFRCNDIDAAYEYFTGNGLSYLCPPYKYVADWSGATVFEAVMDGPEHLPLTMIERVQAVRPPYKQLFGSFADVAQTVESVEEAERFYTGVLGLPKVFDQTLTDGLVDPIVGVPAGTHTRIAMFAGGNTPVVEPLEFSRKGTSIEDIAGPQSTGVFATSFLTEDLNAVLQKAEKEGFAILNGPTTLTLEPYGQIETVFLRGPSGMMVEVFQTQHTRGFQTALSSSSLKAK